jgi:poly(hydroxyalkanoate) depolymerase family esterase
MRKFFGVLTVLFAMLMIGCSGGGSLPGGGTTLPGSGGSASLTQVSSFGSNPGNLTMYKYAPSSASSNAGVVVALHGCTQTASEYASRSGWNELADQYGFYVIYAQQPSSNNQNSCFNWFESGDISRGRGEALSIKQMVDKMKSDYSIDSTRVFVTGLSAGGYMTAAMVAAYPDVFAGGAIMAGGPYKCALGMTAAFQCMSPGPDKSPSQWGSLVKNAASYSGKYPKISIFQGDGDYTVKSKNATELVEQWTNVHGIDTTPEVNENFRGTTHKVYKNAQGEALVEYYLVSGMGHAITVDPGTGEDQGGTTGAYAEDKNIHSSYYAAKFWGLLQSDTQAPVVTVSSPSAGTVSGTVNISASATDNESVAEMKILIAGEVKKTVSASSISYSWDASQVYSGNYVITVEATDAAGNKGTKEVAVTVDGITPPADTQAPVLTLSPAGGTYTDSVTVTLAATDNEDSSPVIYYTTNGSTPTASSAVYGSALTFTQTTTLKVLVKDRSGNSATATEVYTIESVPYTETATGTVSAHYTAGRLDLNQYLAYGSKYGYMDSITLYKLENGNWVDQDDLP